MNIFNVSRCVLAVCLFPRHQHLNMARRDSQSADHNIWLMNGNDMQDLHPAETNWEKRRKMLRKTSRVVSAKWMTINIFILTVYWLKKIELCWQVQDEEGRLDESGRAELCTTLRSNNNTVDGPVRRMASHEKFHPSDFIFSRHQHHHFKVSNVWQFLSISFSQACLEGKICVNNIYMCRICEANCWPLIGSSILINTSLWLIRRLYRLFLRITNCYRDYQVVIWHQFTFEHTQHPAVQMLKECFAM